MQSEILCIIIGLTLLGFLMILDMAGLIFNIFVFSSYLFIVLLSSLLFCCISPIFFIPLPLNSVILLHFVFLLTVLV